MKDVTKEEVQTVFQLSLLKVPSPDSMHATFSKNVCLSLVRTLLVRCKIFVNKGDMLKDLNKTYTLSS